MLANDPEFRKEYYKYDLAYEIGQMLLEARSVKDITQERLAKLIHTKQSGIARAESGTYLPSLSFLNKIANALKTKLIVTFAFLSKYSSYNRSSTISIRQDFVTNDSPIRSEKKFVNFSSEVSEDNTDSFDYQYT